ncbi:MAG: trypsin-like peptidase domain-containing protein [Patescibacteria group bacterium]|jgi:S1-C subfamily serine protease
MKSLNQLYEESKSLFIAVFLVSFLVGAASGALFGVVGATVLNDTFGTTLAQLTHPGQLVSKNKDTGTVADSAENRQGGVVEAVRKLKPAVVSIVIMKDVPQVPSNAAPFGFFNGPFFGNFFGQVPTPSQPPSSDSSGGTQKQEVGGGTGFFVTSDGLIVTNKHVVADESAEYTVLLNDGRKLSAKVLARDPANDLAVVKVEGSNFPTVTFGDSDKLELGQTAIAIGNALGEFRNTVSVGVISGLARSITASGSAFGTEQLSGVVQTDAAINAGNSGGPLANLNGEVVGINTAMASNGQNIGFAIPANEVKQVVDSVKKNGRIIRPFLGVRYVIIDDALAKKNQLPVSYGALIVRGETSTDFAVTPGSPADKAGLKENDIILEIGSTRIDTDHTLSTLIAQHTVDEQVPLKVMTAGKERMVTVTLVERK